MSFNFVWFLSCFKDGILWISKKDLEDLEEEARPGAQKERAFLRSLFKWGFFAGAILSLLTISIPGSMITTGLMYVVGGLLFYSSSDNDEAPAVTRVLCIPWGGFFGSLLGTFTLGVIWTIIIYLR